MSNKNALFFKKNFFFWRMPWNFFCVGGVVVSFSWLFYLLLYYAQNQIKCMFTLCYFHLMVQLTEGLLSIIIDNVAKLYNNFLMIREHL